MNQLRFQEPPTGCLIPGLLFGSNAVVAAVLAIGLSESPPLMGIRLITPLYAVAAYWMSNWCNRRTAIVDSTGVRVTFGPVPNASGQFVPRAQIAFCYARDTVANFDEGTVPDGTWFGIGVETRDGRRIHLYSRGADAKSALAAAGEISHVLNGNPAEPPIEARLVAANYSGTILKREVVFWAVLSFAAVVLGVAWELGWVKPAF